MEEQISNFNIGEGNIGEGNIGDTILTATGDITFDGTAGNSASGVVNIFAEEASGSIGEINLTAQNLDITNGADIASRVEANSNSGNINLNIADTIRIDGFGVLTRSDDGTQVENPSSLATSSIGGNSGNININAQNLFLSRNGSITVGTVGAGEAGNVNINTELITIGEQGDVDLPASSINANAGSTLINNPDLIAIGGDIKIDTGSLRISDGGNIQAGIQSQGNGGNITINARDEVSVIGTGIFDVQGQEVETFSSIFVDIAETGIGEAGNIEINAPSLVVNDGIISADVVGEGNGGTIKISTTDSIELLNDSTIQAIISQGSTNSEAGNIEINTPSLQVDQSIISTDVVGEGNGGIIKIFATDSIELLNDSTIETGVFAGAIGNGGDLTIETAKLTLSEGSSIAVSTSGNGNAGTLTIIADESISLSGIGTSSRGGIFASALIENGNGGDINLTTDQLTISDGATITASNFSSLGTVEPGTGEPGNISITANTLSLSTGGRIDTATRAETGTGAEINLQIADSIFLSGDSFISAQAFGNANGGNLNIDTNFIVAFEGNNDIIASAEQGQGGNINITAESLLGIEPGALNPFTNDINASSEFGLDGSVSLDVPDVNSIQGASELSTSIVVPEETTAQACNANRELAAKNGLTIKGKGGVPAPPDLPLDSANTFVTAGTNETDAQSALPQPVKTSIGEIQPARGIKVKENGGIILTAYRTNNQGKRLPNIESSCGKMNN